MTDPSSRIKKTFEETETYFRGQYKGYTIEIEREEIHPLIGYDYDDPEILFSIHVYNPEISFGTLYDGYAPKHVETMRQAKSEALRGSQLVKETP
ncbi:MAG: hypothetical protein QNI84_08125 [Henriciella sp.]|nr:hypothetical protein [Henriciella sp.]